MVPHTRSSAQSSKMLPRIHSLILVSIFVFECMRFVHFIIMNEESFAAIAVLNDAPVLAAYSYIPGSAESYILEHSSELGYNNTSPAPMCPIWKKATKGTPSSVFNNLHSYMNELKHYNSLVDKFEPIPDLRLRLHESDICKTVELHPDGLEGIFPSGQLSWSSSGYIEPLLPPLRHPLFCFKKKHLLNLKYLVHDFKTMCQQLKRTSRTILIDMGASLQFHDGKDQPAVYLIDLFRKFGFPFDHIYAFEVTPTPPEEVFSKLPEHLISSYHWINVGVGADPESSLNPLRMILNNFNQDDFIIIKLDIDTSSIELPLAHQLLDDDRYSNLVDHFYFEHHVELGELKDSWLDSAQGTVQESLDLFSGLRKKGIPAHSWV
jgi:hypothetical protein